MNLRIITGVLAIAATAALAGCGAVDNAVDDAIGEGVENAVEDAIEQGTDGSVDIDLDGDGVDVPESWPADVPVPSGTIISAVSEGDSTVLIVNVEGIDAVESYSAAIEAAGFVRTGQGADDSAGYAQYDSDTRAITLVWGGDEASGMTLQVAVIPLGS